MITLRPYQSDAVQAVLSYWRDGGGNPLVEMATGTGKSLVIADLVRTLAEQDPGTRILMLVHVRELVAQNMQALLRSWPAAPVGINSAGLNRRDKFSQILFASIQSVAKEDGNSLGPRHVVLIDESHLVPHAGDGQYRTLLDKLRETVPEMRVAGFTATPYRLDSGLLHGKGALFDDVVYSYGIGDGVKDGWLSPLVSRAGSGEIDVSGVKRQGGEFQAMSLQIAARDPSVVRHSCEDAVARLKDRKAWLVFCAGVDHAQDVMAELRRLGVTAECVTGKTPSHERDRILRAFKGGQIRALTNANVLTTGFDAPIVDAIVMMRPTLSTGLYVQMLGRGTRLFTGKTDCLVLDYSGNVRRHGPVDAIEIRGRKGEAGDDAAKTKVDSVMAKMCPGCRALVGLATFTCPDCGHEWERPAPKIDRRADADAPVMVREMEHRWLKCSSVTAAKHEKEGGKASMRIEYHCGFNSYSEWVTLDHDGYAGERATHWWRAVTGLTPYGNVGRRVDLCAYDWPKVSPRNCEIQVKRDGKYWRVANRRFTRNGVVYELNERMQLRIVERREAA